MPRKDYRAPLAEAGEEFRVARAALEQRRTALQKLVIAALKAGVPQVEVARLTGYSRENLRLIARKNGIEGR